MAEELLELLLKAIDAQIRDEANRPTFNWTDRLSQMTLGIWGTGTDDRGRPFLNLGEPDEEMSERTGNGGTIYLEGFRVAGLHHAIGRTTRFDLKKHDDECDYFVWVAGDWRPENLATAPRTES